MSSDSGWWARRLGEQPQQRQTPIYPQPQYPNPQYQQQAPQYPQQAPQQPQYQQSPQHPQVTVDNLFEAAMTWQGGPAARTETQPCPQCGGGHYFSRTNGPSRGPAPAPMCYDCGYNGMFIQGDPSTWQSM
jgi:hypothetical protein